MTDNVKEAIRLLGVYTAGRFDIWALAGNSKASCRAHINSALTGRKEPQRTSGVNALRDAFYAALNPAGGCLAAQEKSFRQLCLEIAKGN